jgi:hypothetical protein
LKKGILLILAILILFISINIEELLVNADTIDSKFNDYYIKSICNNPSIFLKEGGCPAINFVGQP